MHASAAAPMRRCAMNMLWNTQVENTCVVFRQWHIGNIGEFIASFIAILLLGLLFEYLRVAQVKMEKRIAARMVKERGVEHAPGTESPGEEALLLARASRMGVARVPMYSRVVRALLYASSTALSAFLMLVFMTYNAYLILAVVIGAGLGHFIFEANIDPEAILFGVNTKGAVCH
ncbi:Ctr copper transporter [Dacryopinax primogenitus]|uniref:Copper transport protein n=1 Tax=Dacryopinax primogenitus (strain DJM 731) TaxID=1858805 RepID=M5G289_DACPD|nr:Ctr copper transporter [Dacryopinax primogenitus]EJU04316.1 Ctr copper transporter [Dacryopinax primogenitus]